MAIQSRTDIRTQRPDWMLILLYVALSVIGWMSVMAASYSEVHGFMYGLSTAYGKQALWIGIGALLGIAILVIDSKFYTTIAWPVYGATMVMLVAVLFLGQYTKGSTSWFKIGNFKLQPAEFGKFAAALALAKYMGHINYNMADRRQLAITIGVFFLPMALVLAQGDTGSALVFGAYFLVLYRFGFYGWVIALGLYTIVLFITVMLINKFIVLGIVLALGLLIAWMFRFRRGFIIAVAGAVLFSVVWIFGVDFVFNHVLKQHQRDRIQLTLGIKTDDKKSGYNVRQSMIAIGSGGLTGKGFLKGTMTQNDFVPEQSTDFIFCTIGEEGGFIISAFTIILYALLIMRIFSIAERQRSKFSKVYAYCVACIIFFHVAVNIGMTIGLVPVIGIPLPFISYGGSSILAFTILLFVLIRLDADRYAVLR